jgi:hypothetical protein
MLCYVFVITCVVKARTKKKATDRWSDGEKEGRREAERQRDRETERQRDRETERQRDEERQKDRD